MSLPARVFVARLAGLPVFDPLGDQVGRIKDVVVVFGAARAGSVPAPQAVGLLVEVPGRRRVFVPMTRVTSMDASQVITTGLVNMRRFEQRATETLAIAELFDRVVHLKPTSDTTTPATSTPSPPPGEPVTIEDIALAARGRTWVVDKLFVRRQPPGRTSRLGRRARGETLLVDRSDITDLRGRHTHQGAANLLAAFDELKPADLAEVIHELTPQRRLEVAAALDDERLADVLEEMSEEDQVAIVTGLEGERAADVLEAMQPDDAADLLGELPDEHAQALLDLMDPAEADDVRRLLTYDERTAGGIMTTEPVILSPETTIAYALAQVRRAELSPALAAAVYVCRPPLETPTGTYLGMVHTQRLLREPPHESVGDLLDEDTTPLPVTTTLHDITRHLATYNLVAAAVTDDDGHLLGAVSVDDVLDHLLPDRWRDHDTTT